MNVFVHIVQYSCVFLIFVHNNKPYHIPLKYGFLFKMSDDIRPTYLNIYGAIKCLVQKVPGYHGNYT